ncbi:MAG: flagellar protein [Rhodobiaceae bacterium]|nr:flagellar protein [Rhodobiaceae bacterium]
MSEITLSSAVRNNLLSLQKTASLLGKTQERLATGLKVNSALDDPSSFFTAASLNSRAGDLNRLLDSVGLAVQTIRAADEGISAITKLVESAQATARQALQAATGTLTAATVSGSQAIASDVAATTTSSGTADWGTLSNTVTASGTLTVNGTDIVVTGGTTTLQNVKDAIDAITNVSSTVVTGDLKVDAGNNTTDLVISYSGGGAAALEAELGLATGTVEPTNATLGSLSGTVTFQIGSGASKTITFGATDASSQVNTRAELTAALSGLTGGTLSINGSNQLTATATASTDWVTISGTSSVLTGLGLTAGRTDPGVTAASSARTALETQFNAIRSQIDQLAADASFNGNNLLNGDSLTVIFNEDGSSSLSITGVTFNSSGLAITQVASNGFQSNGSINASLSELDTAIATLRQQASTFGSNLSVVEVRQDFTKNLINTLETGAANLTLADTNEEGANLLALQTRQQLSSVALSLASQADQNVLRLF